MIGEGAGAGVGVVEMGEAEAGDEVVLSPLDRSDWLRGGEGARLSGKATNCPWLRSINAIRFVLDVLDVTG